MQEPGLPGWGLDAILTTFSVQKKYYCEISSIETRKQSDSIFYGRLWFQKGCFVNDDDNDDPSK
jgi:hypothetical protein